MIFDISKKYRLSDKKKILFLGASITQGRISKSYVKMLKKRLGTRQYKFINMGTAGMNLTMFLKNWIKPLRPGLIMLFCWQGQMMYCLHWIPDWQNFQEN